MKTQLTTETFHSTEACILRCMDLCEKRIDFCVTERSGSFTVSYSEVAWKAAHGMG